MRSDLTRRFIPSLALISVLSCLLLSSSLEPNKAYAKKKKKTTEISEEYYDMLVLGVDRRAYQSTGRSDVMMIIHCEPGKITFFSIPRDTLTLVKGKYDKINHSFAYGGARLTKATVERFLKFKVDNYIVVDFQTFLTTIEVIKKLTDDGRLIGAENFLASGIDLLKWLRFRSLPKGDRRRCQRHQLFMKRVFEYTQDMFVGQPLMFGQCMKAGLKIVDTDLTYEHAEQLFDKYKAIDLEVSLERYVLPGYGTSRYRKSPAITRKRYESKHMPNFNAIVSGEGLEGEEAAARKKQLIKKWHRKHTLISYYIPKYRWSLDTYIKWFRKNGMQMNYVEVDTLRK